MIVDTDVQTVETKIESELVAATAHPVHQVTAVSKYLALALFIILPFVGGYIGYRLAPEKTIQVPVVMSTSVSNLLPTADVASSGQDSMQVRATLDLLRLPIAPSITCSMPNIATLSPHLPVTKIGDMSGVFTYATTTIQQPCAYVGTSSFAFQHFTGMTTLRGKIVISSTQFTADDEPVLQFRVNTADIKKLPRYAETGAPDFVGVNGLRYHPYVVEKLKDCNRYDRASCKNSVAQGDVISDEMEIPVQDFDIVLTDFVGDTVNGYSTTLGMLRYTSKSNDELNFTLPVDFVGIINVETVKFADRGAQKDAQVPYLSVVSEIGTDVYLTKNCFKATECGNAGLYKYSKTTQVLSEMKASYYYDEAWACAFLSPDKTKVFTLGSENSVGVINLLTDEYKTLATLATSTKKSFAEPSMGCGMTAKWLDASTVEVVVYDFSKFTDSSVVDNAPTSTMKIAL